jgi:hypothetical protein
MHRICLAFTIGAMLLKAASPFAGRWDINITSGNETYPDWMEVTEKDGAVQARVQPRTGSVVAAKDVKIDGSHLTLAFGRNLSWDLMVAGGKLTGTQKRADSTAQVAGVRAPELKRAEPKTWSAPEALFTGKDLTGWEPDDASKNHWVADNGVMLNTEHGANLRTTRKFQDFKVHFELNCPDGGNSGFYLRGRYEIQVAYEKEPDNLHAMGSIYGFIAPSIEMPRKPGQWESFDATLVGRTLTLVRDGTTLIDHQEIPGITGGALDSNEAQPGIFYIQGDHTGGMKYRNITISEPKR